MAVRHIRALILVAAAVVVLSGCSLFTEFTSVPISVGTTTRADIIDYFGSEPYKYYAGTTTYTADTVPTAYLMYYKAGRGRSFEVVIDNTLGTHVVDEIRIYSDDYRVLDGGLTTGMTKEEVFAIVGAPASTVTGGPNAFTADVFFQDIEGEAGYCYYNNSANGVRMFFSNNLTNSVYIYTANDTLQRIK